MRIPLTLALLLALACAARAPLPVRQHHATALVTTTCATADGGGYQMLGSAVLVGPRTLITAAHVVRCPVLPGVPIYVAPVLVRIDLPDDRVRVVQVEAVVAGVDLARLRVTGAALLDARPVTVGPMPEVGATVCAWSAAPRPTYRCGLVQPGSTSPWIRVEMRVEHGNSGSALYDARGRLVGIVTSLWRCEEDEMCGGLATALDPYGWIVP